MQTLASVGAFIHGILFGLHDKKQIFQISAQIPKMVQLIKKTFIDRQRKLQQIIETDILSEE